ncbi:MAG: DALR anticodon-binding domain-containing protein [Acidimicrobiia bacterium]|nr:DALR anticodon-binding domain-containing protein [Acidimicrobiia bacterium]
MEDQAAQRGVEREPIGQVDLGLLAEEAELEVLRRLSELPDVVVVSCLERAPHKMTTWVRDLAAAFHRFYHDCRIMSTPNIEVPPEVTQARLWLTEGTRIGLLIGLGLLGVTAPERM